MRVTPCRSLLFLGYVFLVYIVLSRISNLCRQLTELPSKDTILNILHTQADLPNVICKGIMKSNLKEAITENRANRGVISNFLGNGLKFHHGIYAYSAYFDDREELHGDNYVRVVTTIGQFSARCVVQSLYVFFCLLWYADQQQPISVLAEPSFIAIQNNTLHGAVFSCRIPTNVVFNNEVFIDMIPMQVTLVEDMCGAPGHMIPVHRGDFSQRDSRTALCLSIRGESISPTRLVEWIEINRLLGANMFYIYNISANVPIGDVLRYYQAENVIVIKEHLKISDLRKHIFQEDIEEDFAYGQEEIELALKMISLNDCLYAAQERFIITTDVNEILQLLTYRPFQDFLTNELKEWHGSMAKFQVDIFSEEFGKSHVSAKSEFLHTMKFKYRSTPKWKKSKSIVDFQKCLSMNEAECLKWLTAQQPLEVAPGMAYVRHYVQYCSMILSPELCQKVKPYVDKTLDQYEEVLQERVGSILLNISFV